MNCIKEDTEESDEALRAVQTDRSTCVLGSDSEQLFLRSKQDSSEVLNSGLLNDTINSFGTDKKCVLSREEIKHGNRRRVTPSIHHNKLNTRVNL
ncbi:uncharacterized [Tachysurus ichikawai]